MGNPFDRNGVAVVGGSNPLTPTNKIWVHTGQIDNTLYRRDG